MEKTKTVSADESSHQATYQDVLDAPPHMVAQIVDGRLYTFPRPAAPHAEACSELFGTIRPPFHNGRGGPGGWIILFEPELHLSGTVLVPDIAGWRRERMQVVPDVQFFELAPDWICEVLSPSTRWLDLGRKREIYAQEGVSHLWLVDPDEQSLEAFELRDAEWLMIDRLCQDTQVSLPPFEAIRINLGDLWIPRTVHRGVPSDVPTETLPREPESIATSK